MGVPDPRVEAAAEAIYAAVCKRAGPDYSPASWKDITWSQRDALFDDARAALAAADARVERAGYAVSAYYSGVAAALDALRGIDFPNTERVDAVAAALSPSGVAQREAEDDPDAEVEDRS